MYTTLWFLNRELLFFTFKDYFCIRFVREIYPVLNLAKAVDERTIGIHLNTQKYSDITNLFYFFIGTWVRRVQSPKISQIFHKPILSWKENWKTFLPKTLTNDFTSIFNRICPRDLFLWNGYWNVIGGQCYWR